MMPEANVVKQNTGTGAQNIAKAIYAGLMGLLLVGYIYHVFWGLEINTIPMVIWILRVITAGLAIWLGKLWKDRGFWFLLAFLLYALFRIFVVRPSSIFTEDASRFLLSGFWLCTGAYGLSFVLNEKELKRFLLAFIAIWTIGMFVYTVIGLFVAFTDRYVESFAGKAWYNHSGQLTLIYTKTIAAAILSFSSLVLFIIVLCNRKLIVRILLFALFCLQVILLALTDTRTAIISISIGISIIIGLNLFDQIVKKRQVSKWVYWTGLFVAICISFLILVVLILQIIPVFNYCKLSRGFLVQVAFAEDNEIIREGIVNRGFIQNGRLLTGRVELWKELLRTLSQELSSFLWGKTIINPISDIRLVSYYKYAHCHNIIIQSLMENGFIGTLPIIAFAFYMMENMLQVMRKPIEKWIRFVPALIISVWIGDIVECYLWFNASHLPIGAFGFIAMGIVAAYSKNAPKSICEEMV